MLFAKEECVVSQNAMKGIDQVRLGWQGKACRLALYWVSHTRGNDGNLLVYKTRFLSHQWDFGPLSGSGKTSRMHKFNSPADRTPYKTKTEF